jgi:hypothetical protein
MNPHRLQITLCIIAYVALEFFAFVGSLVSDLYYALADMIRRVTKTTK